MVSPLATGSIVGGYRLLEQIGRGGAGVVYRARREADGGVFALKVLSPQAPAHGVLLRRFEQEFRAASRLAHPNVVRAVDFGEDGVATYLVMEYVEGESLGEKLERDGRLPEAEAIALIVQVCRGLRYAHDNGVIHRDIKPDNVLVTPRGEAKLTDLGLVKSLLAGEDLTKTGGGLGTPHFMAPEQFRDAKNVDPRCDVYGLGATLYAMVTGQLPFGQCSPMECWMKKMSGELRPARALVPALSGRTERALEVAMAARPDDRPATVASFVIELTGRPLTEAPAQLADSPLLHLLYSDREGQSYALKQSVQTLRQWLSAGLLANAHDLRGSWEAGGPFRPLETFPEFSDLPLPASTRGQAAMQPQTAQEQPATVPPEEGRAAARMPVWVWAIVALGALAAGYALARLL